MCVYMCLCVYVCVKCEVFRGRWGKLIALFGVVGCCETRAQGCVIIGSSASCLWHWSATRNVNNSPIAGKEEFCRTILRTSNI